MLEQRAAAGEGTAEDALESLALAWPAYFADQERIPPMPPLGFSLEAHSGIMGELDRSVTEHGEVAPEVGRRLAAAGVPYGVLAGAGSPMPWGQAARASVELSPLAFLAIVPTSGHFPWLEAPGSVRAALARLT